MRKVIVSGNLSSMQAGVTVSVRCPACKQRATLHPIPATQDLVVSTQSGQTVIGYRRCPNPDCLSLIFIVTDGSGTLQVSYPPERLDFDTTNVPTAVANAITEAVTCHAHECYVAAAIMVRKTLEELCRDRGATGSNLKERLKALGSKVVLPTELLDGLDDLRLLGNDAAHIESQEFNSVGREEVEVGIELAKEVLKAVYQYSALLGRLRALKKP
jgi:hypothetical protein